MVAITRKEQCLSPTIEEEYLEYKYRIERSCILLILSCGYDFVQALISYILVELRQRFYLTLLEPIL